MQEARKKAQQHFDAAQHFLFNTYPVLKDPKLLLGIVTNIASSVEAAMDAILIKGKMEEKVPSYGKNFLHRYSTFCTHAVQNYNIDKTYTSLILDLNKVAELHKKSPVEFPRGNRFIICSNSYDLTSLTGKDMKKYLAMAQEFLRQTDTILNRKE